MWKHGINSFFFSYVTIFISTIIPKQSTDYVIKQKDIWLNREKDISSSIKTRLLVHNTEHFVSAEKNTLFLYDGTKCSVKGNKVFSIMKQSV